MSVWFWAYGTAVCMSAISFVGVLFVWLVKVPKMGGPLEYASLAFAGTILLGDALLHLIPHALEGADHDSTGPVMIAAVLGCIAVIVVPELLDTGTEGGGHGHGHSHGASQGDGGGEPIQPFGIANLVVEVCHNYVDGITIGISWLSNPKAGLSAALAVAVHELPQELGDFMVLRAAGFPVPTLLFWNFAASLSCIGGVATVHFMGSSVTGAVQKYLMAFTAGSFLSLSLNMIFPQVFESIKDKHQSPRARMAAKFLCLVMGGVAVYSLLRIGDLEQHDHGHDHAGHGHDNGARGSPGTGQEL